MAICAAGPPNAKHPSLKNTDIISSIRKLIKFKIF
jgi:hypothetical protein